MTKKSAMQRRALLLSTAALAALAIALPLSPAQAQSKEPLKIGVIMPMTGFGAPTGVSSEVGLKMAIEDVNKAGGILGRPVTYTLYDDQFDPTQSVSLAKRLISSDKAEIIIGPQAGQLALAVMPIMTEANIAYFTAGSPTGVTVAQGPTFFSVQISAEEQVAAMVDWAINVKKAKTIAFLGDGGGNGKAMAERFKTYVVEKGVKGILEQYEQPSTDMTPQLFALRRQNPDIIAFQASTVPDEATFLKNIDQIGWNVATVHSATFTALYGPVLKAAGPEAIKHATGAVQIKSFTYCTNDPVGVSPYAKFLERIKAAYPANNDQIAKSLAAWTYDSVMLAKASADGAGSTEGRKMAAWLENNTVKSLTGDLRATKDTHFLGSATTATVIEDPGSLRADGMTKRSGC